MFGHKWEPAEGVIAESRAEQIVTGEHHHGHHAPQETHVYVVDVRTAAGSAFRASLPAPAGIRRELPPGTRVHLEVNPKTNEVRFDPSHPLGHAGQAESLRDAVQLARDLRREMTAQQHGGPGHGVAGAAGAAGLMGVVQAAAAGRIAEQLSGAGGHGGAMVGGPEAAELAQALMSGGPGREAAIARLKELAQSRGQQGGGPQVFISSEAHVVSGGHVVAPGGQPRVIQPAEPEGFSSGGPAGFESVTPTPPVMPGQPPAHFPEPNRFPEPAAQPVEQPMVQPSFQQPVIPPPASRQSAFGEDVGDF